MNREVVAALKRIHERSEAQQRREKVREHRAGARDSGELTKMLARCLDIFPFVGQWRA